MGETDPEIREGEKRELKGLKLQVQSLKFQIPRLKRTQTFTNPFEL